MNRYKKYVYAGLPVLGALFYLLYLHRSAIDMIYSDYIRLINSYLPDVWNPDKFFVPDLLTRIPVNYLERAINVQFFGYSVTFDRVMGVLGFFLSAWVLGIYSRKCKIGTGWYLTLMTVMFSLNKWEMLYNGTGWAHFLAFACFFYNYLVLDRVYGRHEKRGDLGLLFVLPAVITIGIAGPYCAVYTVTLVLAGLFIWARNRWIVKENLERAVFGGSRSAAGGERAGGRSNSVGERIAGRTNPDGERYGGQFSPAGDTAGDSRKYGISRGKRFRRERKKERKEEMRAAVQSVRNMDGPAAVYDSRLSRLSGKQIGFLILSAALPFLLYLWSNSMAVYEYSGATDAPFLGTLLQEPKFFLTFFLKSFSSMIFGVELIDRYMKNVPDLVWCILGFLVMASYFLALWMNFYYRITEKTIFPLMLLASGGMNHLMILVSRWIFIPNDSYGMSSRYALQYQVGILGIILTFALVSRKKWKRQEAKKDGKAGTIPAVRSAAALITAVFLAGNLVTTAEEFSFGINRKNHNLDIKEAMLNFENETDEELQEALEFKKDGTRNALTILKDNGWNVFKDTKEREVEP